jgi:hypothetical protein
MYIQYMYIHIYNTCIYKYTIHVHTYIQYMSVHVDEWDMEPGHVYWNPHVDKANIPTYEYSALLYLNTSSLDFEGGDFAFLDDGT